MVSVYCEYGMNTCYLGLVGLLIFYQFFAQALHLRNTGSGTSAILDLLFFTIQP
jgi:hypothetical protein